MMKINLNDSIKVKLTPKGVDIYYHQFDEVNEAIVAKGCKPLERLMPRIDEDGYTTFRLWHFMELYGSCMTVGCELPCDTNILIEVGGDVNAE